MSDARREDEERLPWLEPVEEEAEPAAPSMGKTIGLVILGLVLLGAIVGLYSWWSQQGATSGDGELIAAPAGPYKIRPPEPGGLAVEGEGDTAFAASEGADPRGRIDTAAVPEVPMVRPAPKANVPAPKEAEAQPAPATPSGGPGIQLGAFSNEAAATRAWTALAARFDYLAPLSHDVIPVRTGDRTLYRLRVGGPEAAAICGRLRAAGESCVRVE